VQDKEEQPQRVKIKFSIVGSLFLTGAESFLLLLASYMEYHGSCLSLTGS